MMWPVKYVHWRFDDCMPVVEHRDEMMVERYSGLKKLSISFQMRILHCTIWFLSRTCGLQKRVYTEAGKRGWNILLLPFLLWLQKLDWSLKDSSIILKMVISACCSSFMKDTFSESWDYKAIETPRKANKRWQTTSNAFLAMIKKL